MMGAGKIQKPPWIEKRALDGTAARGWAAVLPNWNRELALNVVPPPAITLRVILKRLLLWAKAVTETERSKSKQTIFILRLRSVGLRMI